MKTAIYIEDGVVQLVLTPENEFEQNAVRSFYGKPITAQIFPGTFYDCRGGWTRQRDRMNLPSDMKEDKSIILRIEQPHEPTRPA